MLDRSKPVPCIPAKLAKANASLFWDGCLPSELRERFEAVASVWSKKSTAEWDEEWSLQREPMQKLVDKLAGWMDIEEWELALQPVGESLLLFYVLRVQRAAIRLGLAKDEDMVPAEATVFWQSMMDVDPRDHWILWTAGIHGGHFLWRYVEPAGLDTLRRKARD
jgi:hypothetical protein